MVSDREKKRLLESLERAIPYAENGMISISVEATKEIIALLKDQEEQKTAGANKIPLKW